MTASRLRWALVAVLAVAWAVALVLTHPGVSPVPGALLGIAVLCSIIWASGD